MYFQAKDYSPVPAETKVAFIGLGTMGFPMAGHLLHAGCQVTVYNRTASKAQAWVEKFGGKAVTTPREAAQDADVVFTCVSNDNDLRSVLLGEDGAFAGMKKDAVLWDATTDSAEVAKEMAAEADSRGLHFVDAPVSGGQDGAVSGSLTVMCGGDAEIIERVKPIADAFAWLDSQNRTGRLRTACQDVQSDLYRRRCSGLSRSDCFRADRGHQHAHGSGCDRQRCRFFLADASPRRHND